FNSTMTNDVNIAYEYNVILCGSPGVGKSSFLNALCNKPINQINVKLELCTKEVTCCTFEADSYAEPRATTYQVNFWGIDSWSEYEVKLSLKQLIQTKNPICLIYCASPDSYANLTRLEWLIEGCIEEDLFCALICTNMWMSIKRSDVINDFKILLTSKENFQQTKEEDGIIYYGDKALITMVNSENYMDEASGINEMACGINELIYGILSSLKDVKLLGWLYTIAENETFWLLMKNRINNLFNKTYEDTIWSLISDITLDLKERHIVLIKKLPVVDEQVPLKPTIEQPGVMMTTTVATTNGNQSVVTKKGFCTLI
ncbi:unnamed protein product, partial [Didymodactylos carnosus]